MLDGAPPVLIILAALGAGAFALAVMPREEEPQIVVPSADVLIEAPSLSARQVERLVATPLEKLLAQIDGVEHVYSVSQTGRAVVTVSFYVGEDREDSLLKLYSKVYSHQEAVPAAVTGWVVKPIEVDDVPIVTATLWSDDPSTGTYELRRLGEEVANILQGVPQTNRIEVIGGAPRELQIVLQPLAMVGRSTSVDDVMSALARSNIRGLSGDIDRGNRTLTVELDARIRAAAELEGMTVNVVDGVPVKLGDIAEVRDGPAEPTSYTWVRFAANHPAYGEASHPAVNIAVAKQKGANAVSVADRIRTELAGLEERLIPSAVRVEITRDYGATADAKMTNLISSLVVAVVIVVVLIGLVLGWRSALVVGLAVPICYGLTLLLGYAAGYTVNRVTLFALILALGLLVDDPITGVDNMQRHLRADTEGAAARKQAIVRALLEIRLPLLMSTVAIVIVFAPMSFITGMMGPYMSPMAFNVPTAVVTSTVVAFMVTPWLGYRLLRPAVPAETAPPERGGLYAKLLGPLLRNRRHAVVFLAMLGLLFVLAMLLPMLRLVPLKLLPYDNKNEFQIVIDADEGTTLETTNALTAHLADHLAGVAEVRVLNAYVGVHAPMDFNGLIRRYYLRGQPHQAQLHVVLADKLRRAGQSHELILELRPALAEIGAQYGASVKLVEVPPGPPVIATLVAEHYGSPTTPYETLIEAAQATAERLRLEDGIVDVDVSSERTHARLVYVPDQEKAALSGIGADVVAASVDVLADGAVIGHAAAPNELSPLSIRLTVPYERRSDLGALFVKGSPGIAKLRQRGAVIDAPAPLVSLSELGELQERDSEQPIYHKDLRTVAYAFAEVAGRMPAEVVYDLDADLNVDAAVAARPVTERSFFRSGGGIPWSLPDGVAVIWSGEGEWNITLRVFRDLGIAFGVALLGLFLVIRLQTGLSALTGIIMLAIPLTAIGIMPGFWLMNALFDRQAGQYADPVLFTATAMIGMIALAGIVVRNSLILIEFVQQARAGGMSVDAALLEAGRLRTRPVLLTAGTTLLGNVVITLDPIFAGLAWAIIFGVTASTVFTLFVVPVVYQMVYGNADA